MKDDCSTVLVSAIHQHEPPIGTHVSPPSWASLPPTLSHASRLLQSPGLNSLGHTENSHWLFILHILVYMFPYSSLHSSHPPSYPLLVSISLFFMLCLHCCPANRFISTIFLDFIYIYIYIYVDIQYLFFSLWLTSLCVISSSFIHLISTCSNTFE